MAGPSLLIIRCGPNLGRGCSLLGNSAFRFLFPNEKRDFSHSFEMTDGGDVCGARVVVGTIKQ
jgi:hypothetical protein